MVGENGGIKRCGKEMKEEKRGTEKESKEKQGRVREIDDRGKRRRIKEKCREERGK